MSPLKLPFKNSNPLCTRPTVGANYRGIVTADVLKLGLSRGAIAVRKLEGVNGTRNTRVILVRPLTVKVKP